MIMKMLLASVLALALLAAAPTATVKLTESGQAKVGMAAPSFGGWDLAQTIEYSKELKRRGADWITASSGGISPLQKIPLAPGYQVPLARAVKEGAGINTVAVGLITEAQQAEQILASGQADLVALARGMLYDPRWAWHAAAHLGATVDAPPQYWRAPLPEHKDLFRGARHGAR